MNFRLLNTTLLFSFLLTVQVTAQQVSKDTLDSQFTLDAVVVTASKTPQSRGNVTQKIDVLSAAELNRQVSGNRNVAEALMYLPGNAVKALSRNDANWGAFGGIGPKYSTFMLGGLPIDAFTDVQALSLNAVEQIEVQRGPASVLYPTYLSQDFDGNQSPLAGTTNLILKEKVTSPKTIISASGGSYNTYTTGVHTEQNIVSTSLITGFSFESSDYTNYGAPGSWLNMKKNPDYQKQIYYGGFSIPFETDLPQKVSVFVNHATHTGNVGREFRKYDHTYNLVNFGYSVELNNDFSNQLNLGFRSSSRFWQDDVSVANTYYLASENGVDQQFLLVDNTVSWKQDKDAFLSFGGDVQLADYQTWSEPVGLKKSTGNDAASYQYGLFAQEEMTFDQLLIRGGLRFNLVGKEISWQNGDFVNGKDESESVLLWNLGSKYTIDDQISIFANAGNSFINPALKHIGGNLSITQQSDTSSNGILPNPTLKPESGISMDFGFNFQFAQGGIFSLRGFYTRISNAIVENVVIEKPSRSRGINAGTTVLLGAEADGSYLIVDLISIFGNVTYTPTRIENSADKDQDGSNVPFVPDYTANTGMTFFLPYEIKISPYLHASGKIYDGTSKSSRKSYDQGILLNLNATGSVYQSDLFSLETFANFYNLTDNRFEMPWGFQDPGFSWTGGMRISF
ncbi:MAG: TonB-dependent receptor [Bacteroidetes bacterium]|nr:TonB-dependent receptor [Bacteroidota bacterium]